MRSIVLVAMMGLTAGWAHAASDVAIRPAVYEGKNDRGDPVEKNAIRMPIVQLANTHLSARINDRMFIDQLGYLAPAKPGKLFGRADGILIVGIAHVDYTVSRNDERILGFAFNIEGCGAYCEEYNSFNYFDLRDGRAILKQDIFTAAGMSALNRLVDREKSGRYRAQIATLKKDLVAARKEHGAKAKETIDDLTERVELNTACEKSLAEKQAEPQAAGLETAVELAPGGLRLHAFRCSNHAMRALDDVGDVTLQIPYVKVAAHLTPYGKALLLKEGDAMPAPRIDGQILRGTIGGNMPITVLLENNPQDGWSGKYYYDKYRKPIELRGKASGKDIVLTEVSEDSSADNATMRLTPDGEQARGQFIGKKTYPVELKP